MSLAADPVPEAVEKIRYVPQNYLEEICNEVGLGRESRFYGELQQVIFSHVTESERLGFETLDELLGHKGEEVSKGIDILVSQLGEINREIVAFEERLTARHRKGLELQLAEKRRELDAHEQGRPSAVPKPGDDPGALHQSQQASADLEAKQRTLRELETEIRELRSADGRLARRRTAAERLATKLRNLQLQVDTSLNEAAADLAEVGLTRDQVIRFEVMTLPIEEIGRRVEQERAAIAANLDPERADSQEAKRAAIGREIETLQESLTAPQRAYQEYVQKLKDWEGVRDGFVGSSEQPGTIQFLEKVLGDLNAVPGELRRREKARQRKALEILREKQRLRRYYEDYYGAVQKFLATHPLATSDAFRVTFTVTMVQSGFADRFLARINQRKLGYFSGVEEGAAAVKRMTDAVDWNSARSTLRFAREVVERLKGEAAASRGI